MDLVIQPVPMAGIPWRRIGVVALLALLLVALVAVYAGSRPRLPAPFGRAANGLIAYDHEGDIYSLDPATGQTTALVTGPGFDARPIFSRDGTHFAFARMGDGRNALLFVASADGKTQVQVTPELLDEFGPYHEPWTFSPDGRWILVTALVDNEWTMLLIASDGSGTMQKIPVGVPVGGSVSFRPPDGSEILFVGTEYRNDRPAAGLYAVDVKTGTVRTILAPADGVEIGGASWSPDGARIAYLVMEARDVWRNHVIGADGTGDVRVPYPPGSASDGGAIWSNDGSRLIVTRQFSPDGTDHRAAVVPVDGTGPEVDSQCPSGPSTDRGDLCSRWMWAPDDASILGVYFDPEGRAAMRVTVDPLTGSSVATPWTVSNGQPDWQRLAP